MVGFKELLSVFRNYRHSERNSGDVRKNITIYSSFNNSIKMECVLTDDHSLDDYERGIASRWRLSPPDIDDAMNVGYTRNSLESYVHEFHERGLLFDDDRLSRLDAEWQKWIKKCIDEGDVGAVIYPNNDEPLQKWWMHIESLDDKDVPDDKKDV